MKQNINEELNYMKYLFGYKKGVVISEQETNPTTQQTTIPAPMPGVNSQASSTSQQGGDGCEPVFIVSDSFSAHKADHTKFVDPIMNKITELIQKNPNFQGGTVTNMKIIGGASNVDRGVATEFTLGNDYKTVNQVKNASEPKFLKNMDSAKNRATLAQEQIIPKLKEQFGLVFSSEPTIETQVIDTGGKSDQTNQASGSQLQRGQVVIIQFTVCPKQSQSSAKSGGDDDMGKLIPRKPTLISSGDFIPSIKECFTGVVVKINFDENATDQTHACNKAVWSITANDIPIFRVNKDGVKVSHASLNNINDYYDDAEVRKPKGKSSADRGGYRYNTFTIDEITAKQFANLGSVQKYQGDLQIQMRCEIGAQGTLNIGGHKTSEGGCHKGTVFVEVLSKEVKDSILVRNAPVKSGEKVNVYKVPACKAIYEKELANNFSGVYSLDGKKINADKADPTGALRQMANTQQIPQDVQSNIENLGPTFNKLR
jgi:hypothetical protein